MGKVGVYNFDDLRALIAEIDDRNRKGKGGLQLTGEVFLSHQRDGKYLIKDEYQGHNIVPTEGLNHCLDTWLGAVSQVATWYIGIFKGNYTPISTNTAANALGAAGLYTECQDADYDNPATNRPQWVPAATAAGVITNSASPASFTMAAGITVYGAFLASSQAKTATTGKLAAAKLFSASRAVIDNDVLSVVYQLTGSSS